MLEVVWALFLTYAITSVVLMAIFKWAIEKWNDYLDKVYREYK